MKKTIVTVLGGSRPNTITKQLAYKLGKRIAKKGFILKNGGYSGVMEESAKGCIDNDGQVIGVCLKNSKVPSLKNPNCYLTRIIYFKDYQDRVRELLKANHIIVLPGQIGTLGELLTAWMDAVTKCQPCIYLLGRKNRILLDFLLKNKFIKTDQHLPYIRYAKSIDDIDFLQ